MKYCFCVWCPTKHVWCSTKHVVTCGAPQSISKILCIEDYRVYFKILLRGGGGGRGCEGESVVSDMWMYT